MESFEDIAQQYYPAVFHFLLQLSGCQSDAAEELTQETFLRAYLSISDFRGECQLKTWLIQIAKNCFYMSQRKKRLAAISLDQLKTEPADGKTSPLVEQLYERELIASARLIIDAMQPRMRDVMLYRLYTDLPYAQIGLLLSISEGSAKVLFHRAKGVLRKKLKEEFGYEI